MNDPRRMASKNFQKHALGWLIVFFLVLCTCEAKLCDRDVKRLIQERRIYTANVNIGMNHDVGS